MAVSAADLTRLSRNLIRKEGKMIDSAMIERLRDQVSSAVLMDLLSSCPPEWRLGLAKFYSASPELRARLQMRLRQGERVTFKLPHSTGLLDRVKIGGAFFSASEDPVQDAVNILADMMAAPRPVCWSGIFELDIQSPEHVRWRVLDWEDEAEIQKGTDPLDQALAKMASLGYRAWRLENIENIEESQPNMLSLVGTLEKKLRGWKVSLLRSCCLILMKKGWLDPFFHSIHLCWMPGRAVVACAAIHSGNSVIEERLSAATYREHALPFILEVAKRISRLAVPLSEAPPKPVATQWGRVPVVIAPPDRVLEAFLQSGPRSPEA
jgi:hypothetical protein